jgi:hypothetical protein
VIVKWEYLKVSMHKGFDVPFLNAYGERGWELIQIVPAGHVHSTAAVAYAIFKRPDPDFADQLIGEAKDLVFVQGP